MERRAQTPVLQAEEPRRSAPDIASALAGLSSALVRELYVGGTEQRVRAATRLEAFLGLDAVPHLLDAVEQEEEPAVLASIFESLGRLGETVALPAIRAHLGADDPAVRSAAIEACLRLVDEDGERTALIEQGLCDPSPVVRRRTFLAAAAIPGVELAPWALRFRKDDDPHLRRLAFVALATSAEASLQATALDALLDPDEAVRRAVAAALERRLGICVREIAGLPPAEARRAIAARKNQLVGTLAERAPVGRPHPPVAEAPAPAPLPIEATGAATAPAEVAFEDIERVLLAAIRGMHLRELAVELGRNEADVGAAVQRYLVEGRLALRGTKLFLP